MKKKHIATSLITVSILTGAIIAFFLPIDNVNDDVINKIVAIAQTIFPTVKKMKGGYPLSSVALVYFSTVWLLTPITVFGWYLYVDDRKEIFLKSCKVNRWSSAFFCGLFFPAIISIAVLANFESADTTDIRTFLTYQTRAGLAAIGFWIPVGAGMFLAICTYWLLHIKQIFEN